MSDLAGHRVRDARATIAARSVGDVRRILAAGEPVYPVSTGLNWGFGSRQPVADGCAVLDLGRLRRIRLLDLDRGIAIVEPGVTQRDLAQATAGTRWLPNLTAACADTSFVGNALDRGDGVHRSRSEDLLAVEAVLADGSVVRTGGFRAPDDYAGPACGPDLTQAFVQANLGVVTAAVVALLPRPDRIHLAHASMPLESAVHLVRECVLTGVTTSTPRVIGAMVTPGGDARATSSETVVSVSDPDAALKVLAAEARCLTLATASPDDPMHSVLRLLNGDANCGVVRMVLGVGCADVDSGAVGWAVFSPVIPLGGDGPGRALDLVQHAVDQHGVAVSLEVIVSSHSAGLVVQIPFTGAAVRAHALRATLRSAFLAAGMPPRRSDVDHAAGELADQRWLHDIKSALDPAGVVAPGRYLGGQA